ncbi:MAG TPA: HAD hydrolase family protein [Candidatus Acidoferrum sp.]|nr:HAD hydrolase family protein [Candidatus Acidoferrum sp.]
MAKRRKKIPTKLARKAKQILVLLMDVDGTLTDGSVTLLSQPDGSALEAKTFDAHDGQGLTLAVTSGLRTGVITGRGSAALRRRCKELDIEFVYEKQGHKIAAYEDVLRKTGAKESEVAFLGDDLPDLMIMRRVGLAVAVGNAAPEVKREAHYTTKAVGGKGAAREVVEVILRSKGIWEEMIDKARA